MDRINKTLAGVAAAASILAGALIYYQYFTESLPPDLLSALQNIEELIENNLLSGYSADSQREAITRLQILTQIAAYDAAQRGGEDLPAVYLRSEGIDIKQSSSAELQTPSGDISILGAYSIGDS